MKFAVLAALFATTSAVKLSDDCKGSWCNKGLPYDLDEATLRAAEADNVAKTDWYEHTKLALEIAQNAHAASTAASKAATAADSAAATAKAAAIADFSSTSYKDPVFYDKEAANGAAVHAKEDSLDAKYKADDDLVAKTLIMERRQRDFDSASAAKAASDANLKANQERVAYEKDQLLRGQNQDRLKFVNQDTAVRTSEITSRHWERQAANGALLKSLASF
jgi:hypothetical protein